LPISFAATILHPHYKHHLEARWKVRDDWNEEEGPHPIKNWLHDNHASFQQLWRVHRDKTVIRTMGSALTALLW
jgi:hypothetical protein